MVKSLRYVGSGHVESFVNGSVLLLRLLCFCSVVDWCDEDDELLFNSRVQK